MPVAVRRSVVMLLLLGLLTACGPHKKPAVTTGGGGEPEPVPADSVTALKMAAIAYSSPTRIGGQVQQVGDWALDWGPAEIDGYLIFVARSTGGEGYIVSIRGTVVDFSIAGLEDWYHDSEVLTQVEWTHPPSQGAMISYGANEGLNELIQAKGASSTGNSGFPDYIKSLPSGSKVVVTGHSLGAALTTVLAPWMHHTATQKLGILPITFAAPTAGNHAFVAVYNELFPKARRYFNHIDVVPRAWNQFRTINDLFPDPGPKPSYLTEAAVIGIADEVDHAEEEYSSFYKQTSMPGLRLTGIPAPEHWKLAPFFDEASYQHSICTYGILLGVNDLPGC